MRPSILLVDDEPANRALLRAYLSANYDVFESPDGPTALELLRGRSVDLVLLDVMMPGLSGLEVCERLKREHAGGHASYLPVILLTALGEQTDRNAGLRAGADDFLTKPVDRHELALRVQTFIKLREQDQRIRQQLSELKERDEVIRQQLHELRAVDTMKDDLVALMVHDLRNPLAGVVGFLGLLAADIEDADLRAHADMALEASGQLREILDDLLNVRLLESGILVLKRERIGAEHVVGDAIQSIQGAALARRVEIAHQATGRELGIEADKKLVRRAVENLLSNAVKYAPEGSAVRVAVRPAGAEVEIEVADRGAGVPNSLKEQLFQKFGSVESARGETRRGVGLGLYLVKLVMSAHGGRAVVRDRKHGGTAFGLFLPKLT
jgi:signal transduction histidine kinase